jgi:hypothetical protein
VAGANEAQTGVAIGAVEAGAVAVLVVDLEEEDSGAEVSILRLSLRGWIPMEMVRSIQRRLKVLLVSCSIGWLETIQRST